MANKLWVTQQSYDHKRVRKNYAYMKENPEEFGLSEQDFEKVTVPGQTMTVSEMVKRIKKGRNVPEQ